MKFKGIIFDIDGTLTSTNELIFASFNHITEKYLVMGVAHKALIYKSKQRKYQLPYS